ncbi:MAG: IPT/TIG domain-containing protein [Deltaproteobacteria bacterium]|nr:IPT/TIG domain-containing protein [Deltaproteobacteria bacterium]
MTHATRTNACLLAAAFALLAAPAALAQAVPIGPPPPVVIGQPGPPPPVIVGTPISEVHTRPVIERIEPASGQPGMTVTIVGRNFEAGDQVFFGGASLPVQSVVPTRISVIIPEGARSGRFTVQGPGGSAESSQTFNVVQPPPPPTVTGFAPVAGEPGTDIAIEGTGFSLRIYEDRVSMNGLVLPVRSASTTRLTVTIPEGAADGTFVVDVAGAGAAQSAAIFDVLAPLRVDRLEPPVGPVGTQVRILGSGFNPTIDGNTVKLGDKRCTVRAASPTELVVEVPSRAQTGAFLVNVVGRAEIATSEFRVVYAPTLRSFSPKAGFPGTEVVIKGENFGTSIGLVQASISGVSLPVAAVSNSELRVRIPDNAGTGIIQVTVADAGSVATSEVFDVWVAPAVTSFTPSRATPGSTVTVTGRGFLTGRNQTTVAVNGVSATVQSVAENQIVVTVPNSATTGRIVVNVRGRGEASSAADLTIVQPPSITSVSPRSAPPGEALTITGQNFGTVVADVTVTYVDDPATGAAQNLSVLSLSSTQIIVPGPTGSRSGQLRVNVRNVGETSTSYQPARTAAPVAVPVAVPVVVPPIAVPVPVPAPIGPPPPTIIR